MIMKNVQVEPFLNVQVFGFQCTLVIIADGRSKAHFTGARTIRTNRLSWLFSNTFCIIRSAELIVQD